jgi:transposase InsO family protein
MLDILADKEEEMITEDQEAATASATAIETASSENNSEENGESSKKRSRVTAKDPVLKLAHKRLSVLELAESLGNVSEACRRSGMDRTSFYAYKERFQQLGLEGLKDLPPIHKSHPQTTAPEVVEQVLKLSLARPSWGCCKLSDHLKLEGIHVSSPTIQGILAKHGMASRYERLLKLEDQAAKEHIELTAEQVELIEKNNPCYRERHIESSRPGELLAQDTYYVGQIKGIGKIHMHVVVDTYGSYAFGFLHTSKQPEAACVVLHNDVLPFYRQHELAVETVLTDNGREFCGTERHPFELYLALNDIEHRTIRVRHPQTNGFVERFNRTVKEEFFEVTLRAKFYTSVADLQEDLDQWLRYYNHERPHHGYRNLGRRPIDTILRFSGGNSSNRNAPAQDRSYAVSTPIAAAASPLQPAAPQPRAQQGSRVRTAQASASLDAGQPSATLMAAANGSAVNANSVRQED